MKQRIIDIHIDIDIHMHIDMNRNINDDEINVREMKRLNNKSHAHPLKVSILLAWVFALQKTGAVDICSRKRMFSLRSVFCIVRIESSNLRICVESSELHITNAGFRLRVFFSSSKLYPERRTPKPIADRIGPCHVRHDVPVNTKPTPQATKAHNDENNAKLMNHMCMCCVENYNGDNMGDDNMIVS